MPQRDGPRLATRNSDIWADYISGKTQAKIATEHGIGQQRVSEILTEMREAIGDDARQDAALLAVERASALLSALWPEALQGDVRAVQAALRVLERLAKATGSDAVVPLQVQMEQRLDAEASVVADALTAALSALDLTTDQEQRALEAAQAALVGGEPPPAPDPPPVADPMAAHRAWLKAEGLDDDD